MPQDSCTITITIIPHAGIDATCEPFIAACRFHEDGSGALILDEHTVPFGATPAATSLHRKLVMSGPSASPEATAMSGS